MTIADDALARAKEHQVAMAVHSLDSSLDLLHLYVINPETRKIMRHNGPALNLSWEKLALILNVIREG